MGYLEEQLGRFVPQETVPYLVGLLNRHRTELKIVKDRKTKQGDYRPPQNGISYHRISINRGLNPYAFVITLVHEFAHLETWIKYERRVKPHGPEWKQTFKELMAPVLALGVFPQPVIQALAQYLIHPKASSCSDPQLYRVLSQYNKKAAIHLESLPMGSHFRLYNGRVFEKQQKKRTRYVCKEVRSNTLYLIHGLAQVDPVTR